MLFYVAITRTYNPRFEHCIDARLVVEPYDLLAGTWVYYLQFSQPYTITLPIPHTCHFYPTRL